MGESIDFVRQLEEQMQVYGVKTSRFAVDEESLRRNGGGGRREDELDIAAPFVQPAPNHVPLPGGRRYLLRHLR